MKDLDAQRVITGSEEKADISPPPPLSREQLRQARIAALAPEHKTPDHNAIGKQR